MPRCQVLRAGLARKTSVRTGRYSSSTSGCWSPRSCKTSPSRVSFLGSMTPPAADGLNAPQLASRRAVTADLIADRNMRSPHNMRGTRGEQNAHHDARRMLTPRREQRAEPAFGAPVTCSITLAHSRVRRFTNVPSRSHRIPLTTDHTERQIVIGGQEVIATLDTSATRTRPARLPRSNLCMASLLNSSGHCMLC